MLFPRIVYRERVKVTQSKISALQKVIKKSPKAREILKNWARNNGLVIPDLEQQPVGGRVLHPEDGFSDALTETEMSHVSRPDGLADLHRKGITGKGVTVAVVDSGIAPHPDFEGRIKAFRDFTGRRTVKKNNIDPTGHGTHVSGIIAGDGSSVRGIAPEADLVGCRINSAQDAIKAIDWVIANKEKYSIDVLNLSLGVDAPSNPAEDEFRKAAERAVDAGILVVAAAGNECHGNHCSSTISSPGNSPKVITVGALDDKGTPARGDDSVYATSSRGSDKGGKPDLVAEGVNVLAPLAKGSDFADKLSRSAAYVALAGSSQAAPMVAGALALMLQVNPELSQDEAKDVLRRTADKLKGVSKAAQGAGRLDLEGAVAAAERRAKKAS